MHRSTFIILFLVTVVGAGYMFFQKESSPSLEADTLRTGMIEDTGNSEARYRDYERAFTFSYPSELTVSEFTEVGGAKTLVFEEPGTERAFQMFITPFMGTSITDSTIRAHVSSGIIEDPQEVVIGDGIRALVFWSEVTIVGRSREVWFIKDGYLYEVTTYAALDEWIASILNTLHFDT